MKIKESELRKIIKEEIKNSLLEISPYDQHLIPKDRQWDDDEIFEFLNDKNSISDIINDIQYNRSYKKYYDDLLNSTKLALVSLILKNNLNIEGESQEELEKLSINDLEEFIFQLSPEATKEYNYIKYEFISDLINEDILDKSVFTSVE